MDVLLIYLIHYVIILAVVVLINRYNSYYYIFPQFRLHYILYQLHYKNQMEYYYFFHLMYFFFITFSRLLFFFNFEHFLIQIKFLYIYMINSQIRFFTFVTYYYTLKNNKIIKKKRDMNVIYLYI